ncbi:hypothetical protein [Novosphingobium aquimarinum]|uniref:hypothetical protein n=1 Tax=Novosphingobium aquimarinum TaxID=2682494 RepID=UPI0012EBC67D|nr:hypothetical protein [Novosphingobium aquimarinum]
MTAPTATIVKFDSIDKTLRSVALATAYQQLRKIRWQDYNVLPGLYGYWKVGPGAVTVDQPHVNAIKKQANFNYGERWKYAMRALSLQGFIGLETYLTQCERIRDKAWRDIQTDFAQAQRDNQEAIRTSERAISQWAAIKFVSQSSLAVLSVPAGIVLTGSAALLAVGIGAGTSMACSVAKNWNQARGAKAVAIDGVKEAGKFGVGKGAEKLTEEGLKLIDNGNAAIQSVSGSVQSTKQALQARNMAHGSKTVRNASAAVVRQEGRAMIQTGSRMAAAGKFGIPIVFAALDIYSAWGDYKADTKF